MSEDPNTTNGTNNGQECSWLWHTVVKAICFIIITIIMLIGLRWCINDCVRDIFHLATCGETGDADRQNGPSSKEISPDTADKSASAASTHQSLAAPPKENPRKPDEHLPPFTWQQVVVILAGIGAFTAFSLTFLNLLFRFLNLD